MAKTINKDISIFTTLSSAEKAFSKTISGDLLHSEAYKAWYIDTAKTALIAWPNSYKLISTK